MAGDRLSQMDDCGKQDLKDLQLELPTFVLDKVWNHVDDGTRMLLAATGQDSMSLAFKASHEAKRISGHA